MCIWEAWYYPYHLFSEDLPEASFLVPGVQIDPMAPQVEAQLVLSSDLESVSSQEFQCQRKQSVYACFMGTWEYTIHLPEDLQGPPALVAGCDPGVARHRQPLLPSLSWAVWQHQHSDRIMSALCAVSSFWADFCGGLEYISQPHSQKGW